MVLLIFCISYIVQSLLECGEVSNKRFDVKMIFMLVNPLKKHTLHIFFNYISHKPFNRFVEIRSQYFVWSPFFFALTTD